MLLRARETAERAVELDPSYSGANATLGFALMWSREHEASLAAFERAVSLNPNDVNAINLYGMALSYAGRYDEALGIWEISARLDPFRYPIMLAMHAMAHAMSGQLDEALPLARNCVERAPWMQNCQLWLAITASELGHEEEARAAAARLAGRHRGMRHRVDDLGALVDLQAVDPASRMGSILHGLEAAKLIEDQEAVRHDGNAGPDGRGNLVMGLKKNVVDVETLQHEGEREARDATTHNDDTKRTFRLHHDDDDDENE
jgi:tetratricopeptide (TPR) repeat protein